jgi:hypothetical protein
LDKVQVERQVLVTVLLVLTEKAVVMEQEKTLHVTRVAVADFMVAVAAEQKVVIILELVVKVPLELFGVKTELSL